MAGLNIYYRPKNFAEMIGNKKTVDNLKSILGRDKNTTPHAFLLQGISGGGKTTLARIIANKLGCPEKINRIANGDYMELDVAHFTGVETARDIRRTMKYKPIESACKVWVLDEFHKASNSFQSAMLKALEDTPSHCYFILCTTEPKKILPTIRNRCSAFEVKNLDDKEANQLLDWVLKEEDMDVPKEVKQEIVDVSDGCPRQILVTLDKIIDLPKETMLDSIKECQESETKDIRSLCQELLKESSWEKIAFILKGLKGTVPETIRRSVLGYMNAVLLNGNTKAALVIDIFKDDVYNVGMPGITLYCYQAVTE